MGRFIKQIWQLPRVALKQVASDILRLALLLNRPRRLAQKGFVLPTTVLLTIMVALTATALTYRTFIRSEQAIGQREQQVIVNAATPAIDRAKAKIEFLFRKDNRLPAGLPSSDVLYDLMSTQLGTGNFVGYTGRVRPINSANPDPYTLPDETRVDINGDGDLDNAWRFTSEGKTLVYSILVDDEVRSVERTPPPNSVARPRDYVDANRSLKDAANQDKANSLITRTGPLATAQATPDCQGALSEAGWQVVTQGNSSQLQKNFQITAFVANESDVNQTFETLEFQQSRQAARGNKWGAWFRYDLDIYAGTNFHWNGAMHTDGNFIVDQRQAGRRTYLHMVSSPNSCVYDNDTSEITAGVDSDTNFQGQFIKGFIKTNEYTTGDGPTVHVFNGLRQIPILNRILTAANDSVNQGGTGPYDLAVNPLRLFTEDVTENINPESFQRNPDWNGTAHTFCQNGDCRMVNDPVSRPFVDDFYRADNRWGPKPRYDSKTPAYDITNQPAGVTIGDPIVSTSTSNLDGLTNPLVGLDGYWERQAIQKGLRLIVGQRLELGNANGWNYDPTTNTTAPNSDPLYPANKHKGTAPIDPATELTANTVIGGDHEYLQRKALRDNLAAVQGMVVYHYDHTNGGEFPAACVALTAHPGTQQTIVDSRTFGTWLGSTEVKTDFLNGKGTNGWEFQFPTGFDNPTSFASAISAGQPLGNALRNLAYFAGDPDGGAPSFKPLQDAVAHPFPYMAMWGDFSILRRILASNETYANLSPADQATLHSASCTLGMLAYNLKSAEDELAYLNGPGSAVLQSLSVKINEVSNSTLVGRPLKEWLAALNTLPNPPNADEAKAIEALARWGQINRDRQFGFSTPATSTPPAPPTTRTCSSADFTGVTNATDQDNLAYVFCSGSEPPKYPSLFYLFPKADHSQTAGQVTTGPGTEEYITPPASIPDYIATVNGTGDIYTIVDPADIDLEPQSSSPAGWTIPTVGTTNGLATATVDTPNRAFVVNIDANNDGTPDANNIQVPFLDKGVYDGREQLNTRVLDIDLEALTTRTVQGGNDYWLPADLDEQAEGVVYAFREDAVREDEIVRPQNSSATVASCTTATGSPRKFNLENDTDCLMRVQAGTLLQDPPLTDRGISLKPVDFIPDPERRPHGFRLRTASGNPADFSGTNLARKVGMTLVTDNSVYIMGDFNLHSTTGQRTGIIEEFEDILLNDESLGAGYVDRFYARATLNTDTFANLSQDHWRPVEILSDAMSILSIDFRDGALVDGFLIPWPPGTTGVGQATSSYMNQNRPITPIQAVVREDGTSTNPTPASLPSPVYLNRDGTYYVVPATPTPPAPSPFYAQYTTAANWINFGTTGEVRKHNLQPADPDGTVVNAVFVSGIVPNRPRQVYGGLHNYPRFLEYWRQGTETPVDVTIAGAFIQLNFSTASTAPYEQVAWESGQDPSTFPNINAFIEYYQPPNRRWGYDVGLLYVPPAPAARRFVTFGAPRSEYYRELPADDPYVVNLRCARNANGALVFPDNNVCPS